MNEPQVCRHCYHHIDSDEHIDLCTRPANELARCITCGCLMLKPRDGALSVCRWCKDTEPLRRMVDQVRKGLK